MVITRAPYRISFFGGGTDFTAFYQQHGGAVLSTTIDHYCYLSARWMPPYLGARYSVLWSSLDRCERREDIRHPGVRGCLQYLGIDQPFELNHAGDLPARSGMGSSSAFTVAMLLALHTLRGEYVNKERLSSEAIAVEQVILQEAVGVQDQIAAANGGFNLVNIHQDGSYSVHPLSQATDSLKNLRSHLLLFFTGIVRNSTDIAKVQIENTHSKVDVLKQMMVYAGEAAAILSDGGPIRRFGELLHESWLLKRSMSDLVSNSVIDEAYDKARMAGAIGGKLLGAGGGGFLLIFADPQRHNDIRWALKPMVECPARFEKNGAQVVLAS